MQLEFEQAPNHTIISRFIRGSPFTIRRTKAFLKVAPTTTGTYDLDIKVGGSTILTTKLSLKSGTITNNTWTNASINNGHVPSGNEVQIIIASNNVDLKDGQGLVIVLEISNDN